MEKELIGEDVPDNSTVSIDITKNREENRMEDDNSKSLGDIEIHNKDVIKESETVLKPDKNHDLEAFLSHILGSLTLAEGGDEWVFTADQEYRLLNDQFLKYCAKHDLGTEDRDVYQISIALVSFLSFLDVLNCVLGSECKAGDIKLNSNPGPIP